MAVRRTASALPSPVARFGLWRPGVPGATEASGSCRWPLPGPAPARCAAGRDRVVWFGPVGPFYACCSCFSSYRGVLSEGLSGERPGATDVGRRSFQELAVPAWRDWSVCFGYWGWAGRVGGWAAPDFVGRGCRGVCSGDAGAVRKIKTFSGWVGTFPAPPRYKCPSMSRIDPVFRTPDQRLPLRRQG